MQGDLIRRIEKHRRMIGHVQIAGVPDRAEPDDGEIHFRRFFKPSTGSDMTDGLAPSTSLAGGPKTGLPGYRPER